MIDRGRAVANMRQPGPRTSGESMALPIMSATTEGAIIGPDGGAIDVMKIRLEYRPDSPLTVRFVLGPDEDTPHPWDTSRDVLKTAFLDGQPAGFGDFTCVPVDGRVPRVVSTCPGWVRVALSGQDDQRQPATLEVIVPPARVRQFLKATFVLVPPDQEHKRLAIPDTVESIRKLVDDAGWGLT